VRLSRMSWEFRIATEHDTVVVTFIGYSEKRAFELASSFVWAEV